MSSAARRAIAVMEQHASPRRSCALHAHLPNRDDIISSGAMSCLRFAAEQFDECLVVASIRALQVGLGGDAAHAAAHGTGRTWCGCEQPTCGAVSHAGLTGLGRSLPALGGGWECLREAMTAQCSGGGRTIIRNVLGIDVEPEVDLTAGSDSTDEQ